MGSSGWRPPTRSSTGVQCGPRFCALASVFCSLAPPDPAGGAGRARPGPGRAWSLVTAMRPSVRASRLAAKHFRSGEAPSFGPERNDSHFVRRSTFVRARTKCRHFVCHFIECKLAKSTSLQHECARSTFVRVTLSNVKSGLRKEGSKKQASLLQVSSVLYRPHFLPQNKEVVASSNL